MGFSISLILGYLFSVMLDCFGLGGEPTIYTDENRKIINADLFTPPLAKRIRKRNAEILERDFAVSILQQKNAINWMPMDNINAFSLYIGCKR